jgi:hypothetical protein
MDADETGSGKDNKRVFIGILLGRKLFIRSVSSLKNNIKMVLVYK